MNDNDLKAYNLLRKFKVVSLVNALLIFKDNGIKGVSNKLKEKRQNKKAQGKKGYSSNSIVQNDLIFEPNRINVVFENDNLYEKYKNKLNEFDFKYNFFVIGEGNKTKSLQFVDFKDFGNHFSERSFIYIYKTKKIKDDFPYAYILKDSPDTDFEKLLSSTDLLKLLANYENKNNITVKASTFFNFKGTNYYSGGAERYLLDLFEVSKELDINLDIYQNAEKPFIRKFRNINVIGMYNRKYPMNFSHEFQLSQMDNYINMTRGKSQLHIFSAFNELYGGTCSPSIGISHGIFWDNPYNKLVDGNTFWDSKKKIIESAINCDKMISVDTNTANWFQTIDYNLGNQKIKVIPNYVDTTEFSPDASFHKKNKIVITYPRRLYEPRGMYLLLDIIDDLFAKYKNVEVHFVGKGFDEDVNKIKEKMKKYPTRLFCYSKEPEKMHEIYKMSDISLVPTLYSEGTSLSCLEAMATGNIVICTRIGGLTDLVINGLNGYQIEPDRNSLLETLEHIIENIGEQDIIRENAMATAKALNKDVWKQKWAKEIKTFKLKNKSDNIGLVEFYVKDANNLSSNIIDLIKEELINNNLVYVRSDKEIENDNISFGLLQLLSKDEEIVSKADRVYVEKGVKVKREEEIITI